MRATSMLLLLVLSVALLPETEGRFWDRVKDAVKKAGDWIKENCSVGLPPHISCKLSRRRRQVDQGHFDETLAALKRECPKLGIRSDASLVEIVEDAFSEADENGDGELDMQESALFQELIMVLTYCAEQD